MEARFTLGQCVATPGAIETMRGLGISPVTLLALHQAGDWGTVDDEDRQANEAALRDGTRFLSSYGEGDDRLWVITEADRSVTTILRPDEY